MGSIRSILDEWAKSREGQQATDGPQPAPDEVRQPPRPARVRSGVTCPYCGNDAESVTGQEVYPHRRDLWEKGFFQCVPCDARVGTHDETGLPLGRLATAPLRRLRTQAHGVLDVMWRPNKGGLLFRGFAYKWLAKRLGTTSTPHIGAMSEAECQQVIDLRGEIAYKVKQTKKIWEAT